MSKGIEHKKLDGSALKIGVAVSRWNDALTSVLRERCVQALGDFGVKNEHIIIVETPGSFELPFAAKVLIERDKADAVVCLGCLIKGETAHFEYIAGAVSHGIMQVGLDSGVPVIFGVLTCLNEEQARTRASKEGMDHGYEWGLSAVEMGLLRKS